jgi:DNA-binding NtrC family response regulator
MMAILRQIPESLRLSALIGEPEDFPLNQAVNVLGRRGIIVHQAHSSGEVIRIARERRVDFLLLDMDIPEMGGLRTYHVLKEMVQTFPCILFGCPSSAEVRRRALEEEAFTLVPKPLETRVLTGVIDRLIEHYFPNLKDLV